MRILHIIPSLAGGGAERQMTYLVQELAQRGHDVFVGFMRRGDVVSDWGSGVEFEQFRASGNHDPRILGCIVSLIRRCKPDVVQSWILQMDVFAAAACAVTRTPWVLREPSTERSYPVRWKRILRELMGGTASAIVSNSHGGDRYWKQHSRRVPRFVVPNGIPLDTIDAMHRKRVEDLGLAVDERLLVYGGRLVPGKNLEVLIAALGQVVTERRFTVVFCGDGVLRGRVQALADELLGTRAVFLGHVEPSRFWSILKLADGFVFPSEFEGMPNVVVEAMACRCPVLVSDIPAHRELVDCASAILVDPCDVTSVATGIVRLMSDDPRARVRAARERAEQWSIAAMADRYETIYDQIRK